MAKLFRFKCPKCGRVFDIPGNGPCPKCGTLVTLPPDAIIHIYRMGSPLGAARRWKLFLNEIPLGYLWNMETVVIPVPYGHYVVRSEAVRKRFTEVANSVPIEFDLTPNCRFAYLKAHNRPTYNSSTIILEPALPEEMPPV